MNFTRRSVIAAAIVATAACNAPPTAPVVAISPVNPKTDADLKATVITASTDPNGDAVVLAFQWLKNNEPQAGLTTDSVPADKTAKGDVWTVIATPNDGKIAGPAGQASATIQNTAPTATVAFEPTPPSKAADLKVVPTAVDPDGDKVTFTYAWTKDGNATTLVTDTVPATQLARGQKWQVTVTPNDGTETGQPFNSSVEIANAKPVAPGVTLAPAQPTKATPIIATAQPGTDADGDTVQLKFAWTVDGHIVDGQTGAVLAPSFFAKGNTVTVIVTPNDGREDGAPVTASVVVANTAPTVPAVSVNARPKDSDDVVCTIANPSLDIDGDVVAYVFAWTKNEQAFNGATSAGTTSTIASALTAESDTFKCSATATDGHDTSAVSNTAAARVNAKPALASVALTPVQPTKAAPIYAQPATPSDADNDVVQLKYQWLVAGNPVQGQTASALSPNYFSKGQSVTVIVTPFDGIEDGTPALANVSVQNSPPTAPGVTITASPRTTDPIVCTVAAPSADLDSDSISYTFAWTKNGQTFNNATTIGTTSTVAPPHASGDAYSCMTSAFDGTATTASSSASTAAFDSFRSCAALKAANPAAADGVYSIDPDGVGPIAPVSLFCDMTNGGWTLVANIYDSAGDDAPNGTDFVVSGWQQTASGAWNNTASRVEKNSSGTGSAAVSLAFVAALKAGATQQNLKMCFVHQAGYDTSCRSSADGSMTLVSNPTGNPKLTVYSGNTLPYTYGRLAGLAGSADGYNPYAYALASYLVPRRPGQSYDYQFGSTPTNPSIDGFVDYSAGHLNEAAMGAWHTHGGGISYRPWFTNDNELGGQAMGPSEGGPMVANPSLMSYGFRLYVGP